MSGGEEKRLGLELRERLSDTIKVGWVVGWLTWLVWLIGLVG